MKRITAIRKIMRRTNGKTIVVSSNGMVSRDLFWSCDRPSNFYMLGSMGCALAIGIGIAYTRPDLKVVVISGDGSALMSLNTMALHNKLKLKNLTHYILDNNAHATTGGQPTCSDAVDFASLAPNTKVMKIANEKGKSERIPLKPVDIQRRFKNAICNM